MRRPGKPTPLSIIDLNYNPQSGRYEISERRITYNMDIEHTRSLKVYFKGIAVRGYGTKISDWYNKLEKQTKKEIVRTSDVQKDDDFCPDQRYEDLHKIPQYEML